jgi:hypothetical protein
LFSRATHKCKSGPDRNSAVFAELGRKFSTIIGRSTLGWNLEGNEKRPLTSMQNVGTRLAFVPGPMKSRTAFMELAGRRIFWVHY